MERIIKDRLAKDPVMNKLLKAYDFQKISPSGQNVFDDLVKSIIYQQLSIKAAGTIYDRFAALFKPDGLHPQNLKDTDDALLRQSGVSRQKARYLKEIASAFETSEYRDANWLQLTEEESMKLLTRIKGVGVWTAKMIQMSSLGKEDVFAPEDLGIRLAMCELYQLQVEGKELLKELHAIAEHWRPYRTYACFYLWRWKDDPSHS